MFLATLLQKFLDSSCGSRKRGTPKKTVAVLEVAIEAAGKMRALAGQARSFGIFVLFRRTANETSQPGTLCADDRVTDRRSLTQKMMFGNNSHTSHILSTSFFVHVTLIAEQSNKHFHHVYFIFTFT